MTKRDLNRLISLGKKLEDAKTKGAKMRDEIRAIISEAEEIANSFDAGADELWSAIQSIKIAVDYMSE